VGTLVAGIPFQKRRWDVFVSYAHADFSRVDPIVRLLRKTARLNVWFDVHGGNASEGSAALLSEAIGNSRAAIFFLSNLWKSRKWCDNELEWSFDQQGENGEFSVIAAKLENHDPPAQLKKGEILDFEQITPDAVASLLRSLGGRAPQRVDNGSDVYLSAPWSKRTQLTDRALEALKQPELGWRLVGDSPSHQRFGEKRVEAIVRTTRGMVVVLPYNPLEQKANFTSEFILNEANDAIAAKKPLLLLYEHGVLIPDAIANYAFRSVELDTTANNDALQNALHAFSEKLAQQSRDNTDTFIFYAGSLRDRYEELQLVIERASNMPFERGEGLEGANAPMEIIALIKKAALVIADVSDDRRNTMVEVGAAMALDKELRLLVRNTSPGTLPKKAFMLEGREVFGFDSLEEHLCLCYNFARQYRRKVYFG
jgi:hypothetical protein